MSFGPAVFEGITEVDPSIDFTLDRSWKHNPAKMSYTKVMDGKRMTIFPNKHTSWAIMWDGVYQGDYGPKGSALEHAALIINDLASSLLDPQTGQHTLSEMTGTEIQEAVSQATAEGYDLSVSGRLFACEGARKVVPEEQCLCPACALFPYRT